MSNYHSPAFLNVGEGMRRRKKDKSGTRERHQSEVKCPEQNKDYSNTFGKIDSSNMKEQMYDLKFESKKHNWLPKLVFRIFGVNSQNAYAYYRRLVDLYTPLRVAQDRRSCMHRWTHYLLQRGNDVRVRRAEHASVKVDLTTVIGTGQGRRRRSDARVGRDIAASLDITNIRQFEEKIRKHSPWRHHQSVPYHKPGRCKFEHCPGFAVGEADPPRAYDTFYYCEQCSAAAGKIMYFCNGLKGKKQGTAREWNLCLCHASHHKRYHDRKSTSMK